MDSTRVAMGVFAFGALAVAGASWWWDQPINAGVALRVAVILGAVWLAWPNLIAVPRRGWWVAGLSLLVLLARPRAAMVAIPVILVVASLRRRD